MKPSDQPTQDRIQRFKTAIFKKWKCTADFKCDCLSDDGKTLVSVLELSEPPATFPEAKKCFVWDDKNLTSGDDETVTLLDQQIPSDEESKLPELAIWYWRNKKSINEPDFYVSSEWSKVELDKWRVMFHKHDFPPLAGDCAEGTFFVRERADGKIAIRIKQNDKSTLRLNPDESERIKPHPTSSGFWVQISIP